MEVKPSSSIIEEIYVETDEPTRTIKPSNQPIKPPPIDGPRQRYQRFREKAFVCDECDHWFTLKQNVQMHIFNYHMGPSTKKPKRGKRYKCTKCDQIFKTLASAQKHEARAHKEKPKPKEHMCGQCDKVFKMPSQLREHISIVHLNERPFKCDKCGSTFSRRGGLRRHNIMVHTDHVFKCPYEGCDHPGYKCSKALTAHIRSVHTKERPFECTICEKTFVRKNDLKMHEQTHVSTSNHACEYCHQTFKRLVYMRKHQRNCAKNPNVAVKREIKEEFDVEDAFVDMVTEPMHSDPEEMYDVELPVDDDDDYI